MPPKFSLIIPTLNEEKFLPDLLQSILLQQAGDYEVIVVDGKSQDRTVAVGREFEGKLPLRIIEAPRALLPYQRNLGAASAQGEWFVFIDADSQLLPYFLAQCDKFLAENSDTSVFTTWFRPDSERAKDAVISLFGLMVIENSMVLKRPLTPGPLTAVRRDVFEKLGGYSEKHKFNEDVDFGLRLQKLGIKPNVVRETLFVWSLRRIRNQGTLKVMFQYFRAALPILLFNRSLSNMKGYSMGGHLYEGEDKP
jgi:glycosyltransferase involved in cell wall biosynthesis